MKIIEIVAVLLMFLIGGILRADTNSTSITSLSNLENQSQFYRGSMFFYSESTLESRTNNLVTQTKAEARATLTNSPIELYLGTAFNQDTKSTINYVLNENGTIPYIGVRTHSSLPIFAFVEQRYVLSRTNPDKNPNESRGGFVTYGNIILAKPSDITNIFSENYGEGIFSSRLENNIFANFKSKLGCSWRFDSTFTPDLFLEGAIKRDRLGYYYENNQEIRFGTRLRINLGSVGMALTAHYALGSYTDRAYIDPNPYDQNYNEWKGLFVIYGSF